MRRESVSHKILNHFGLRQDRTGKLIVGFEMVFCHLFSFFATFSMKCFGGIVNNLLFSILAVAFLRDSSANWEYRFVVEA